MHFVRALPRAFYDRDTVTVAKELLGKILVRKIRGQRRCGRIVEVEAYCGPEDLACHAARGRTARTEVMFGPPGHAYVYLIYGMHHCLNIVTEQEGRACAVLIRALEPIEGITGKTSGPGLLCSALGITREENGMDLCGTECFLTPEPVGEGYPSPTGSGNILATPRIGVDYAGPWAKKKLRFLLKENPWVSGYVD